jgi:hypothetical protein
MLGFARDIVGAHPILALPAMSHMSHNRQLLDQIRRVRLSQGFVATAKTAIPERPGT